jgi:NADH:ubiquinone oxidoreductase subunit 5 (subunit L)/multisubunit Na+/H+ antiporter MnhA subunit
MEGPTPVSALLHAATMVTAGVFLILRCSIFFEYSECVLNLMMMFGGITAIFCAIIALYQNDIKKVIAYSTCSQLGYMFFACSVSNYQGALYHLFNHAFFKALLFLGAGVIIHALFNEQDMRKMGKLITILPITYICFIVGSFAIMGLPFFSGFFSKDFILEFVFSRVLINSEFIYLIGVLSALFTAMYSSKILIHVFFLGGNYNNLILKASEKSIYMLVSIIVLTFFSIFIGFIMNDGIIGKGSFF